MGGHLLTMVEFKIKKMNKIIAIIFLFIAAQSCAQIDPYQIIKDSLGAHRILLTDSNGEYTRVLLRDAIADSIGVGKFVNGTDPLDAVYTGGNVGIGTATPSEDLDVDGDIKYSGTLFNGSREEYNNSNIVRVNQIYDGNLVGSYFETGDYQKILTVTPDGSSEGYHITGNIYVQSGAEVQTLEIDVSLRSQTLPDLVWEISYNNNHTGINYLKPFLWTKETTTASFILGFEVIGGRIYGSATADLTINCRNSNDKNNIVLNGVAASDQLSVDAGFTERYFDLKIESAPSIPIISNGQFVGKYPKDSGLQNVIFGYNNLSSHITGTNNFVSGQYNATASTTNQRNFINGERNFRYTTPTIQYSFANGYNNNVNNVGSAQQSFLNGIYNLEEAQNLAYTFANGRDNGKTLTQANYSFFSGYRNAYNSTANTNYNAFIGRENAVGAADIDYSAFFGYQNNFSGNSSNIDYSFIAGERNAYNAGSMLATNIMGYRNAYTTTNSLNYFTAIGRENAYYPTLALNNTILLGYRQGYSTGSQGAAAYRLAIGMYQDNPLIYGEFDNALVNINGDLEVTGNIETDGDLGAEGELNITGEVTFSNSLTVQGDTDISAGELLANDVIVLDRTGGAAVKSAFFDSGGQLIEGDLVSGAYVGYGGIKSVFKTISSTAATLLNLQNTFGSTNTVLGNAGSQGKITIDSSGYWQVIVSGGISDYTIDEKLELEIWVNGASTAIYNFWKPETGFAINVTHVLELQSDDYVQLKLDSVTDNDYNYSGVKLVLTRLANN